MFKNLVNVDELKINNVNLKNIINEIKNYLLITA